MAEQRLWYLVCCDIRQTRRWRRCFRLLKGYGESLQYSVFRCRLNRRQLERLRWDLGMELADEDSIIIAELWGGGEVLVVRNEYM